MTVEAYTMARQLHPIVENALDAEWEINAAVALINAARNRKGLASAMQAYAQALQKHAQLGRLVVAEGLQAQYRQASIDRINQYTSGE